MSEFGPQQGFNQSLYQPTYDGSQPSLEAADPANSSAEYSMEVIDDPFTPPLPETVEDINRHFNTTKALGYAAVLAACVGFVLEQNPSTNEAFRVALTLDVLKRTHDDVAAGATFGALTFGIELAVSSLMSTAINVKDPPAFLEKVLNRSKRLKKATQQDALPIVADGASSESNSLSSEELSALGDDNKQKGVIKSVLKRGTDAAKSLILDTSTALAFGAGIVTIRYHRRDSNPSLNKDLQTSLKATSLLSGACAGLAYLATGGIVYAKNIGIEPEAQWFLAHATKPKDWAILVVGLYGSMGVGKIAHKIFGKPDTATDLDTTSTQ